MSRAGGKTAFVKSQKVTECRCIDVDEHEIRSRTTAPVSMTQPGLKITRSSSKYRPKAHRKQTRIDLNHQ